MLNEVGSKISKFEELRIFKIDSPTYYESDDESDDDTKSHENFAHELEVLTSWSKLIPSLRSCTLPCMVTDLIVEVHRILIDWLCSWNCVDSTHNSFALDSLRKLVSDNCCVRLVGPERLLGKVGRSDKRFCALCGMGA